MFTTTCERRRVRLPGSPVLFGGRRIDILPFSGSDSSPVVVVTLLIPSLLSITLCAPHPPHPLARTISAVSPFFLRRKRPSSLQLARNDNSPCLLPRLTKDAPLHLQLVRIPHGASAAGRRGRNRESKGREKTEERREDDRFQHGGRR
jgi:hypothetical protein